jgi:hypothetical protein
VTCRALAAPVARRVRRVVCRADRIVGAEPAEIPRFAKVMPNVPAFLDQATECPLAPGGSGPQQHGGHRGFAWAAAGLGVDSLTDCARSVPALEADRRQEQMRHRVQEVEANLRELPPPLGLVCLPKQLRALDHRRPSLPGLYGSFIELEEDPLAPYFGRGEPLLVAGW